MPNKDFYDEREPNAIERDRMERRNQTKRKSRITSILVVAIGLAAVIGIIVAVVSLVGNKKGADDADPTVVTATIASDADADKETTSSAKETTSSAPKSTQAKDPALNNLSSSKSNDQQQETASDSSSSSDASSQSSSSASSEASSGSSYGSGNTLHYTATGQTSYGYDWTYSGGGGIVSVNCGYDFDNHQYDFSITGVSPGTTSLTLYYNTADGVQQPVNMTVQVDSNLNVTQIG